MASSEPWRANGCRWWVIVRRGGLKGRPLSNSGHLLAVNDNDDEEVSAYPIGDRSEVIYVELQFKITTSQNLATNICVRN